MTEEQHQAAIIKWSQQPKIREKYPELALLFHIPNGGRRDPVEGRHFRLIGVKKGVPDLCLPVPRGRYGALYIELKAERGRLSPEQIWWGEKLKEAGNQWCVAYGWEQAVRLIERYLEGANDGGAVDVGT